MRLQVSTVLPCSANRAFALVRKWSTLQFIAWPLVRILPRRGDALPDWREGEETFCRSYLFGVLPIGLRSVRFVTIDPERGSIVTLEHDMLVRRWQHEIDIAPLDPDRSRYTDTVEIDAGFLTWPVWAWACWFYRHRQRRWQQLLRR